MTIKRFISAAILLLSIGTASAQEMPKLPVDPNVRIGHLDNGLTYYLRHNNLPEHVADYYIVQRVGSINEDENQRGLAHLLEHLAFNGTDHFKDNDLQEYLQSIGVEYGSNLNAQTGFDKTFYYFTDVPTTRATAIDSCLLILKDWSNGITLTQKAIDDERDVVHNEYRLRMKSYMLLLERNFPRLMSGSKYGNRIPIGLMSVIDSCNPEAIRSYYRKWYRPDNQAIIVVGDINVDSIENKIKTLFADIKVPADAAKVLPEPIPDNDTAIYIVDKNKEITKDEIDIYLKSDVMPAEMKSTLGYYMYNYSTGLICNMLNDRFMEKANEPDCPYLSAHSSNGNFYGALTKNALETDISPKPGKAKEAYAAVLTELKRAHDFGFTATEIQRATDDWKSGMEKAYTNRDKMKNYQFTGQYMDNYIDNEPIPSVEQEYEIFKQIPPVPAYAIKKIAKKLIAQTDTNFVTFVMMQEKDDAVYPTEKELADIVAKVRATPLEAYVDNVKQEPLISKTPKAGKIVKTEENSTLGFKQLTLSNGAKVILKKTDFKDDEIRLFGRADGGYNAIKGLSGAFVQMYDNILGSNGLGNFSYTELQKALAGKQAGVSLGVDENRRILRGNTTPKDLETMMQLIYLHMTAINKDENSMKNTIASISASLKNQSNNPQTVFSDSVRSTTHGGDKFYRIPTSEEVEAIDCDMVVSLAKRFFGNAKDFTFYFVGNFDEEKILPLIKTYIASLPNKGEEFKMVEESTVNGEVKNEFTKQMETPQNEALEIWKSNKQPYTLKNMVAVDFASRLLNFYVDRNIREKLSASYAQNAYSDLDQNPDGTAIYKIYAIALLNPEKSAEAIPYFFSGMDEVLKAPNADDMKKSREIFLNQFDVNTKTNGYWISVLTNYMVRGVDTYTDYKATVNAITDKDVIDCLQNVILKSGNHAEIIMNATK